MKKTKNKKWLLICSLAAFLPANGVAVNASARSHMTTTGFTSQPIGHDVYCRKYSSDCKGTETPGGIPKLTRARWAELDKINSYSNNTVKPVTDQEYYRVEELWAYPDKYGDCEDYVLMKRHMLMQRGWPASSLLITVVRQPNGDGHAVLTVRTDRADYVLDNLTNKILPWHETRYQYLKRQSTMHAGRWQSISDNRFKIGSAR